MPISNELSSWERLLSSIPTLAQQAMLARDLGDAASLDAILMAIENRSNDITDFLRRERDKMFKQESEEAITDG